MKRPQKSFSVEIKKSRTQGQRHHLPPPPLFEVVPPAAEGSRIFQNEAMSQVAEPTTAPRILPSIVESIWSQPEPARGKRSVKSKADEGPIEHDLQADLKRQPEVVPVSPSKLETGLQMEFAPVAEVTASHLENVENGKGKARTRRKKPSEFVEPAEEAQPASQPPTVLAVSPGLSADLKAPKAVPARLTKRQAAVAQLSRGERWKRRLHPATW
ncbi:MAG: hypothetical protein ABW003_22615 [Microvirga sp.]